MRLFLSIPSLFNPLDSDWADPAMVLEDSPVPPPGAMAQAVTPVLAGSATAAAATTTAGTATSAASAATKAATATPAIALADRSILAGPNQSVAFSSLFTVGSSTANPAYLIVSGLDRDEYTAGYKTSAMGHLAGSNATQGFGDFNGDGWSVGVVFTYQAGTGQYTNATFGNLSQLVFDTGSNRGDTATISVFGTSNASLATSYAANPYILAQNPAYFTDYGSVAVLTGASAATPPSTATPAGIVSAALGYVGQAWNDDGCWILASDISAQAGATLPLTSTSVGVPGIANGEWFVAYDGPVSASGSWVNNLVAGEMVSFQTTSGGGHITTVVSGSGTNADLVDNITYVSASGAITDSAHDGSASDILVQAPHPDMQEFSGVNPATVVVYELDTPVVTDLAASVAASLGGTVALSGDLAASNAKPGEGITQYQVYETNAADTLSVSGVAERAATSAATACTITSLAGLNLTAGAAGTDTVEVRACNGSYWGDWTALTVAIAAPVTAAAAIASIGTAPLSVADTAANIGAGADKLQALAASGRLTTVSVTNGALVPLTAGQVTSDAALLRLLPATAALQVSGATVAQAAALQANAQVASFAMTDTAADITGHTALGADGKLSTIVITGTAGADTLDLTGIKASASINLSGDSASAVGGLNAAKLAFNSAPDAITLGSGAATITAGLSGTSGITTVANFQFGLDALQLTLGALPSVQAFNTTYNGAHAIALTGGSYAEGVVLLNQSASVTAASVLASHMHTSGGVTTIS